MNTPPESQPGTPPREDSWFSSLGLHDPTRPGDLTSDLPTGLTANLPPSVRARTDAPSALQRIYGAFAIARGLLGVLMLVALGWLNVSSTPGHGSALVVTICALYAAACLAAIRGPASVARVVSPRGMLRRRWLAMTVGVDLVTFGLLMVLVGPGLNVAALFALPVLMAASLAQRRIALAVAAVAALMLLGGAALQAAGLELSMPFMQAGLAGAGLFTIAVLTSELAARLAREEDTARSSLALARQQALLNRLVIEEMQDGVLVADRQGQVRAANPAALALIGLEEQPHARLFSLRSQPTWAPLVAAVERAYAAGTWPEAGRDITLRLRPPPGAEVVAAPRDRTLRLRVRFARRREREIGEALCVLFLEDVRTLRARAQQEKLAAMGRVSAGIAHEIRNPLAAIAQANALLAEDLEDPAQRQLATIVADNVERLRRIVDDVMAAAPGGTDHAEAVDLSLQVGTVAGEWLRTNGLAMDATSPLSIKLHERLLQARFDPDHLRRVVVNLLDNAWRHGTQTPGAIRVVVERASGDMAAVSVASDGPPIDPDVERHLFEPFFSTRSRGSGLGLYICRELCARYGAAIEYRAAVAPSRHSNVFVVTMPLLTAAETPNPQGAPHDPFASLRRFPAAGG